MSKNIVKKQAAQVVTPLVELIKARLEADAKLAELKEQMKPYEEAKKMLNESIIEEFKRRGEYSTKIEGATVSLSVRKTAQVINEKLVIEQLKAAGMNDYISEALNEQFDEVKKQIEQGEYPPPNGVVIAESEYISIRKTTSKDPRKLTTGKFISHDQSNN